MKIAIVTQRFGEEILGGAELHLYKIIEMLIEKLSCSVDVITTTAKSHVTWNNEYEEGVVVVNNKFRIIRYDSFCGRSKLYPSLNQVISKHINRLPINTKLCVEKFWFSLQGVPNNKIFKHIKEEFYDKIIFSSYYFYTTIYGVPLVKDRSIIIPTVHDEFQFHVSSAIYNMLHDVGHIISNGVPERDLILQKAPSCASKISICGLGFDEYYREINENRKREKYIVFVGRADAGKNCITLLKYFLEFCKQNIDYSLYFVGTFDLPYTNIPRVKILGRISEEEKKDIISKATALINLSMFESLSMVVLEAMMQGTPILVTTKCKALNYYTKVTPTSVFGCDTAATFIDSLNKIISVDWQSDYGIQALKSTQNWAMTNYNWDKVARTFKNVIEG